MKHLAALLVATLAHVVSRLEFALLVGALMFMFAKGRVLL